MVRPTGHDPQNTEAHGHTVAALLLGTDPYISCVESWADTPCPAEPEVPPKSLDALTAYETKSKHPHKVRSLR